MVHQSADLAWAIAFFALGRKVDLRLNAKGLVIVALPWALLTSAIEHYLFLPRVQRLVPVQVPYWTASMVHRTPAAAYPLLPWIRSRAASTSDAGAVQWAKVTFVVLSVVAVPVAAIEALGGPARGAALAVGG